VFTSETAFTQVLGTHHGFTPSISALVGYQKGSDTRFRMLVANGDDNYWYWNAGLTIGWEKFTADFRYWDTNVSNSGNFCTGTTFQCDERFVMTFKFTY
jgi:hypothetical protein